MSLIEDIEQRSKEIVTDTYSMSVGEIISMYKDGDLDIHPEFQRFFRWKNSQKSRLIESFLLNFPVPPIFVYQRKDGIWDVVDGLQRLSTILQFVGEYRDEKGELMPPLVLEATKLLPSLEGMKYMDEIDETHSFGITERRYLKKARLDIIILKKESDPTGQYEVFQRLNTGGTSLSAQEVRNCMMVMKNPELFRQIRELAEYSNFVETLSLSENSLNERFDMELVTRFICMRHENVANYASVRDFSDYLNDKILALFDDPNIDWEHESKVFKQTFDAISSVFGGDAFCKYDFSKSQFKGGFYLPAFEFLAVSIGLHNGVVDRDSLKNSLINIWREIKENSISWQGKNHRARISKTLDLGNKLYENQDN